MERLLALDESSIDQVPAPRALRQSLLDIPRHYPRSLPIWRRPLVRAIAATLVVAVFGLGSLHRYQQVETARQAGQDLALALSYLQRAQDRAGGRVDSLQATMQERLHQNTLAKVLNTPTRKQESKRS